LASASAPSASTPSWSQSPGRPDTIEHARRLAAEHYAFCNDLADMVPFDEYADKLISAGTWAFWWD
jgi:Domain of unknown function (DUF4253)